MRLRVADRTEHRKVSVVPTVRPFRLPIIFDVVLEQIVPYDLQIEIDGRNLHINIFSALMKMKHRFALATCCCETRNDEALIIITLFLLNVPSVEQVVTERYLQSGGSQP